MANVFFFTVCSVLILLRVESCYIPDSLYMLVPQTIQPEQEVARVGTADCDSKTLQMTLSDRNFKIKTNGSIVPVTEVYVGTGGRTFYVRVQDGYGPPREMKVHLIHSTLKEPKKNKPQDFLKRSKRRWSPPPFNILENDKGPFPKDVEKIVSDSAATHEVYYTFSGPGYNENPVGVFSLDQESGMLKVHKPVDRESFPNFTLTTKVFDKYTHQQTDLPLDIIIIVDDVNDNAPEFKLPLQFTVPEHSIAGTSVGKVVATDKDQEGSEHVMIRYSLLTGSDLFSINQQTGVITTVTNTLDREVKDKHLVTIQIKDMRGQANGLSTTGTATITLGDINDNPPTFTKTSFTASVNENEKEKLILRIPVEDKDLVNSKNWIAKFLITKGNENQHFRIDTDPKTNEGLLYVTKPFNFEQNKNVRLEVMARNEAELSNTKEKWQSIPVDVTVTDVDEGPEFTAPTIRFTVKENTPNDTVIGKYTAVDPETKSSAGIKYYKAIDPAGWINVDRGTGELRVANTIDRESHFVENGIYNVTMKAVDSSSKTGTGTVIITVEDVNDNVPLLPTGELVICEKQGELGSVLVEAVDKDAPPLSSPYSFSLPADNDGRWSVTRVNATTAELKHIKELPTGIYDVPIHVSDLQGFGNTQTVTVRICECRGGVCLAKDRSSTLGGLGVLTMLLPLLLLLLLCLLLCLFCVTKRDNRELDDITDGGGILLKSNTEGKGDEVDASLLIVPTSGTDDMTKGSVKDLGHPGYQDINGMGTLGGQSIHDSWRYKINDMHNVTSSQYDQYGQFRGQYSQGVNSGMNFEGRNVTQNLSLHHNWLTNGRYLEQKLGYMGTEEDGRYADDIVHSYGYEGAGSAAGSVGCCSDFGDSDNLDFLNTLGPKFKTLAGVSKKT
ncbi:desmocollin 2-like protein isoform X1 [Solea solea]|uniref:desmocollin 2-like protein isoform X1 n=1 Tax=Solea solea TaxID=90069 RepID=UPI00272D0EDD|nr:desmocollin 2-like protein isoform X1 [Solea solea]